MNKWLEKNIPYLKDKKFLESLGISILILAGGIELSFFTIAYATRNASGPVTDLILNRIPVFNVHWLFVYGPLLFWAVVIMRLIYRPKEIPFTFKSIGLFLIVRSFFITLTHVGPFPSHISISPEGLLGALTSGNDLFFSGHTGLPFLITLVFWSHKKMRWFSLASSIFFGAIVLMAHLHYSIDVFGAFFITYAIFRISLKIFKADHKIFIHGFADGSEAEHLRRL